MQISIKEYIYLSSATAVCRHCHQCNPTNDMNSFKITGCTRNNFHLYRTGDSLGKAERSIPLAAFY